MNQTVFIKKRMFYHSNQLFCVHTSATLVSLIYCVKILNTFLFLSFLFHFLFRLFLGVFL